MWDWSANTGTTTAGTPAAIAAVTVPEPPWQTIAAACGMTSACGIQRATCTLGATGPSSAGSRSRPTRHEHAHRQHRQGVDRRAVEAGEEVHGRRDGAEGQVDAAATSSLRHQSGSGRGACGSSARKRRSRSTPAVAGSSSALRDQAEAGRLGEPRRAAGRARARSPRAPRRAPRRSGRRAAACGCACVMPTLTAGSARGLGREAGGEVGDVVEHHVRLQALDRGDACAGRRRACRCGRRGRRRRARSPRRARASRARRRSASRSSAGGSGIGWWSRPASAIIGAAEAGAVTTTSSLLRRRAWAKGIRGPK